MGRIIDRRRVMGGNHFIQFEDPIAKELCVAKFGGATGGRSGIAGIEGEITYKQAAAVTTLAALEFSGSSITSFDEFQYFTGITTIPEYAFHYCKQLSKITLPESVRSIGFWVFISCTNLVKINIPVEVTSIGNATFEGCSSLSGTFYLPNVEHIESILFRGTKISGIIFSDNLKSIGQQAFNGTPISSIDLPETITSIGWGAFIYSALKTATIRASIPPTLAASAFPGGTTIYVPSESVEAYKSASNWSTYADRIYAIPT